MLVIGVICVGFLLAVPLYRIFNEGSLSSSDIVNSTMEDLNFHIASLSVVDAGVHHYTAPDEVDITVYASTITVSHGDRTGELGFTQKLVPSEVHAQRMCIVKNRIGAESEIRICESGDVLCCTPKLE